MASNRTIFYIYTVSQKGPTFKLSVTFSNLNRFSKFLHCWKAYEICYKNSCDNTHNTLGMLLHYLRKLKIQIFCRYSADIAENRLRFDKVTKSSKVGTFLRHSVYLNSILFRGEIRVIRPYLQRPALS